jgi:Amidohydrolase family
LSENTYDKKIIVPKVRKLFVFFLTMVITIVEKVKLFDGGSFHASSTVRFDSESGIIFSVTYDTTGVPVINVGDGVGNDDIIIDGTGHTLIPGLIEGHMHAYGINMPGGKTTTSGLQTALKCGITTVCDMHSDLASIQLLRSSIGEELKRSGPQKYVTMADLKSSLLGATVSGGWPKPIVLGQNPSEEVRGRENHLGLILTLTVESHGRHLA